MMKTTEAQKRALLALVYPKLVSSAKKNRARVKVRIAFKFPMSHVTHKLVEMGLAKHSWIRRRYGNEERDVSVMVVSAEGKQIARAYCRELIAAARKSA